MIFTSYSYVYFLAAAYVLHWSIPGAWRKPFLIGASYVFYCTWNWHYGFLLLGLSLFNWAFGRWMGRREDNARLLWLGIGANLVPLLYYKYTHFLLDSGCSIIRMTGLPCDLQVPPILLPLGISFFTFQGMAYLVDVAAGEVPFQRLKDFLLYKAFWPQLIAGPIIRPGEIRAQILSRRILSYDDVSIGCRRILAGAIKKVVLADTLAPFVDQVFAAGAAPHMVDGVVGTLAFGLQIYFDFSAYSDIAIGTARLFGYVFPENFAWPYRATSPQEFWNRWHMTLSRWIKDYVFTPLFFTFRTRPRLAPLWLAAAMAICGFWHGARWTFVLWGLWHGMLLVVSQTLLRGFFPESGVVGTAGRRLRRVAGAVVTLVAVNAGWILFRAPSVRDAARVARSILTCEGGLHPALLRENAILVVVLMFLGLLVVQIGEGPIRRRLASVPAYPRVERWVRPIAVSLLILAVIVFDKSARAFVYFQF